MDAREIFKAADSVRLTEVSLVLVTPPGVPGGTRQRMNVCLPKVAGSLDLTLNTQTDLGLPIDRDIKLTAQKPLATGQPPTVTWDVDEKNLNVSVFGITIDSLKGAVTASFLEIPKTRGSACDNTDRAVGVSFQTVGTDNEVDLFVTGLLGDFRARNIQFLGGTAGERLNLGTFDVSIRPQKGISGCQVWAREGETVWFDAIVTNLPSDAIASYQWTIPGAIGRTTDRSIQVRLPTAGTNLTVAVTVTATQLDDISSSKPATLSFPVLSAADADALERWCSLRHEILTWSQYTPLLKGSGNRVPGFVDPIWDELPFFRPDGLDFLSPEGLRVLFADSERLRIQSASVAASLERVLSQRTDAARLSRRSSRPNRPRAS
jgi:hypothetical protein